MGEHPYIIRKILNNNVVISENEYGQEIIVTGAGIGFRHRIGSKVDKTKILNIYILQSAAFKRTFEALLNEIPFDCIQLTEQIIEYSKKALNKELNENLIVTLSDHINFAVNQCKQGTHNPVLVNEEIKRFYKEEYNVGLEAVRMINRHYDITLSLEEAASIAFHLINAELNASIIDVANILTSIDEILKIIEQTLGITLREDSIDYSRLVIHLKFFVKRILDGTQTNEEKFGQLFLNPNEGIYEGISACLDSIQAYVNKTYKHDLTETERVYLLIHIARIIQTN